MYSQGDGFLLQTDEMKRAFQHQKMLDTWVGNNTQVYRQMMGGAETLTPDQARRSLSRQLLERLDDPRLSTAKAQIMVSHLEALASPEFDGIPETLKPNKTLLKAANQRVNSKLTAEFEAKEAPLKTLQAQIDAAPDNAALQKEFDQKLKATYGTRQAPKQAGVPLYEWDDEAKLAYAKQQRAMLSLEVGQKTSNPKLVAGAEASINASQATLKTKQTLAYTKQLKAQAALATFESKPSNVQALAEHRGLIEGKQARLKSLSVEKLRLETQLSAGYDPEGAKPRTLFSANETRVEVGKQRTETLAKLGDLVDKDALAPRIKDALPTKPQQLGSLMVGNGPESKQGLGSVLSQAVPDDKRAEFAKLAQEFKQQQRLLDADAAKQIKVNTHQAEQAAKAAFNPEGTKATLKSVSQELANEAKTSVPVSSVVQHQANLATLAGKNYQNPLARVLKHTRRFDEPMVKFFQDAQVKNLVSKNPIIRNYARASKGIENLMGTVVGKPMEALSKIDPRLGKLATKGLMNLGIAFEAIRLGKNLADGDYKHAAYNVAGAIGGGIALAAFMPALVTAGSMTLVGSFVVPALWAWGGSMLARTAAKGFIENSGLSNQEDRDNVKLQELANRYGHVTLGQQMLVQKAQNGEALNPTEQAQTMQAQQLMAENASQQPNAFQLP